MNREVVELRRRVLRDFQRGRAAAVLLGDRAMVAFLDDAITRQKARLAYACGALDRAARGGVFCGPRVNRLPPPENPRDNRAVTGLENGK